MIKKILTICILGFFGYIIISFGCPIKKILGISCPGCGLTRAYKSLMHGNIKQAFYYHPLFWTIPILGYTAITIPKYEKQILITTILMFNIVYFIRLITNTLI